MTNIELLNCYLGGHPHYFRGSLELSIEIQNAWKLRGVDTDRIYDGKDCIVRPISENDYYRLAAKLKDYLYIPDIHEFIDYEHSFLDEDECD
jgi:hypothetical protein